MNSAASTPNHDNASIKDTRTGELPGFPKEVSGPTGAAPGLEVRALEELSRLNNELANLQRELARRNTELEATNQQLREALANVKELRGLLPICSECKRIRDDKDYWHTVESYIASHSHARFSHGLCPACEAKFSDEINDL
jgi:DNA repair exonuclease SbcCD ATPase subunit